MGRLKGEPKGNYPFWGSTILRRNHFGSNVRPCDGLMKCHDVFVIARKVVETVQIVIPSWRPWPRLSPFSDGFTACASKMLSAGRGQRNELLGQSGWDVSGPLLASDAQTPRRVEHWRTWLGRDATFWCISTAQFKQRPVGIRFCRRPMRVNTTPRT